MPVPRPSMNLQHPEIQQFVTAAILRAAGYFTCPCGRPVPPAELCEHSGLCTECWLVLEGL